MIVKLFTNIFLALIWLRWPTRITINQLLRITIVISFVFLAIVCIFSPAFRGFINTETYSIRRSITNTFNSNGLINRWIFFILTTITITVFGGYMFKWRWTGLVSYTYKKDGKEENYQGKNLWDWLQLLIIPIVLAGGALLFNYQSEQTQQQIANDNQQEATLQKYFDDMSELLLDKNLLSSQPDDEIRNVVRTKTLSTLRRLDYKRNKALIQFLRESNLIVKDKPFISLDNADLSNVELSGIDLSGINLSGTDLSYSKMDYTILTGVDLSFAKMVYADLNHANLSQVNFTNTDLQHSYLYRATIYDSNISDALLSNSDLSSTFIAYTNLFIDNFDYVNLYGAILNYVKIYSKKPSRIDLSNTYLYSVDVSGIDLSQANLSNAKFDKILYDASTIWPENFTPPPSEPTPTAILPPTNTPPPYPVPTETPVSYPISTATPIPDPLPTETPVSYPAPETITLTATPSSGAVPLLP